jgi:hypothetical protein
MACFAPTSASWPSLSIARELRIAYIWETHQENAAKAGLASTAVADLLCGKELSAHDVLYPPVQRLAQHFLQLKPIPQDLHDHLVTTLGLAAFVQLAVVIGYYRMIAGLATGFEFPLPKGMSNRFLDRPPSHRTLIRRKTKFTEIHEDRDRSVLHKSAYEKDGRKKRTSFILSGGPFKN